MTMTRTMTMTMMKTASAALFGAALLIAGVPSAVPANAQGIETFEIYLGDLPPSFATPEEATDALKQKLAANDLDGVSRLLGLNPAEVAKFNGITGNFAAIREGAAKLWHVTEDGEQRIVEIGEGVWPFPFPVRKLEDGKWAFDSEAGLQEIVNRRVGENELQAIATARAYVDGQADYAAADRDGDGVLEYAQQLVSSPGKTDGLYWPIEQGDGESPAGSFVDQAALGKAKAGNGYFGYRFRILRGQGANIAGGRYDYVINGNMIAGYGLIAVPVKYGITGVNTFVVNQQGIVYEKDLGAKTEAIVKNIVRFDPDASWEIVNE
jgi:hypothetical protein